MSTPRDIHTTRPSAQHRQSLGTTPTSLGARQSSARSASQAGSVGSYTQSYRVNRRKSTASQAGFNVNVLAAAIRETGSLPQAASARPGLAGRSATANVSSMDVDSSSGNLQTTEEDEDAGKDSSAVVDGPPLLTSEKSLNKSRTRRASEGNKLGKLERSKSNAGELRCDKCGKGYKHGSCLTKHLWEHTPEWALTSKLLISKHQQVQLLEAASVLVAMNQDDKMPLETIVQRHDRDTSSESPVASGSSDPREDDYSSRTSTPSADESDRKNGRYPASLRPDRFASAMSRSYQSTFASSAPNDAAGLSYYRQWSSESRPTSSNSIAVDNEDQSDLAAAAEGLLTCSLGTPKTEPVQVDQEIPPVPPLPAKYTAGHRKQASASRGMRRQNADVRMADDADAEDDEGIFGQME